MNKQELIKEYESIVKDDSLELCGCYNMADKNFMRKIYKSVLEDLEQLDEPQKVTITQFVADLIEYAKIRDWDLEDVFLNIANELDTSEISEWFYTQGNMDVIARAWLDGYTVEKEKRYLVKVKGISAVNGCLKCDVDNSKWFFSGPEESDRYRAKHTIKELDNAGFGWVFDCEGIELEEVEE